MLFLTLSLVLSSCQLIGLGGSGVTFLYSGEVTTLNYLTTSTTNEYAIAANVVDGLVEHDQYGVIKPSLATTWTTSPDGKVWTFNLRQGAKWYTFEGKEYAEVVAQDFVDAAEYILTSTNASNTADLVYGIVAGAKDFYDEVTTDFSTVGIKAVDTYKVEYTLIEPCPYFLSMLTYVCFLPANGKFLGETGAKFGTDHKNLLYCGAYIIKNFEPQNIRELVKNNNYWDKDKVLIPKITYRYNKEATNLAPEMFLRNQVSAAGIPTAVLDAWMTDAAKKQHIHPVRTSFFSYFYAFNFDPKFDKEYEPENWKKAVNNINFRKSIFHALDRTKAMLTAEPYEPSRRIINTVTPKGFVSYGGTDFALTGPLAEISARDSFDATLAVEYRDKAKADLAGNAKFPVIVMMPYSTGSSDWTNRVQVIEQQLEELLGADYIDVVPVGFPATGFLNATRRAGNYCLQECNWGPDYADPQTYTDPFIKGSTYNWPELAVGYTEANGQTKYNNMVAAAKLELTDLVKRAELFADAEAHLINEAFIIPYGVGGGGFEASKLDPFTSPYASFGMSMLKYKGQQLLKKSLSMDEYKTAFAKWEGDRINALKTAGQ